MKSAHKIHLNSRTPPLPVPPPPQLLLLQDLHKVLRVWSFLVSLQVGGSCVSIDPRMVPTDPKLKHFTRVSCRRTTKCERRPSPSISSQIKAPLLGCFSP